MKIGIDVGYAGHNQSDRPASIFCADSAVAGLQIGTKPKAPNFCCFGKSDHLKETFLNSDLM